MSSRYLDSVLASLLDRCQFGWPVDSRAQGPCLKAYGWALFVFTSQPPPSSWLLLFLGTLSFSPLPPIVWPFLPSSLFFLTYSLGMPYYRPQAGPNPARGQLWVVTFLSGCLQHATTRNITSGHSDARLAATHLFSAAACFST